MSNTISVDRKSLEMLVYLHSTDQYLDIDMAKISALLAAPAVERQEPVAWVDPYTIQAIASNPSSNDRFAMAAHEDRKNGYTQRLYTSPPAPVAVVLPETCPSHNGLAGIEFEAYSEGWNACLDKVKELNQ